MRRECRPITITQEYRPTYGRPRTHFEHTDEVVAEALVYDSKMRHKIELGGKQALPNINVSTKPAFTTPFTRGPPKLQDLREQSTYGHFPRTPDAQWVDHWVDYGIAEPTR